VRSPWALVVSATLAFCVGISSVDAWMSRFVPRGVPPRTCATSYRSQNFEIATYGRILERARGVAGIARRGALRFIASGVLVAQDLVLTCRHCTHVHSASPDRYDPSDLVVRFEGGAHALNSHPVVGYAYTSASYDLCLLRIGPDINGDLPDQTQIQTLAPGRLPLGTPLYVLHHPKGGGLRVADGAEVVFPYESTDYELAQIEARLRAEGDVDGTAARAMRRSYREGTSGTYLNLSSRWAGQPTLGADCATFDGSSGAPVYSKRTHELCGIVYAGGDPRNVRRLTSWLNHEAILPADVIAEELRKAGLSRPPQQSSQHLGAIRPPVLGVPQQGTLDHAGETGIHRRTKIAEPKQRGPQE